MTILTHSQFKTMQITLVVVTGTIGIMNGVILGKVNQFFQKKCHFFSNVTVETYIDPGTNAKPNPKKELTENLAQQFTPKGDSSSDETKRFHVRDSSVWSENSSCYFINFEGIVVFLSCFIWLWFYIHMENIVDRVDMSDVAFVEKIHLRKLSISPHVFAAAADAQKSKKRNHNLIGSRNAVFVVPPIVVNSLLFLSSLTRAVYISDGYAKFCDNLCQVVDPKPNTKQSCIDLKNSCATLEKAIWIWTGTSKRKPAVTPFHTMMDVAIALSWIEPLTLALHVLVIMVDIYMVSNPPKHSPAIEPDAGSVNFDDVDFDEVYEDDCEDSGEEELQRDMVNDGVDFTARSKRTTVAFDLQRNRKFSDPVDPVDVTLAPPQEDTRSISGVVQPFAKRSPTLRHGSTVSEQSEGASTSIARYRASNASGRLVVRGGRASLRKSDTPRFLKRPSKDSEKDVKDVDKEPSSSSPQSKASEGL